jgi:hypothetical protein
MQKRSRLLGFLLPLLMLALASLACDLEQEMANLTDEPQTFTAREGWEYVWRAEVTPGKEYEVTIATVDRNEPPIYAIIDVTTEVLCEACIFSADGYVLADGLSVNFTAPERGRVRIQVFAREGLAECIIQIREIP